MRKSWGMEKRGISPVIASVLIILLVVVLVAIIFLWARGFLGERVEKFGSPIESYCDGIDFSLEIFDNGGYDVLEVSNRGDVGIASFEIRKTLDGDSEIINLPLSVFPGTAVSEDVPLLLMSGGELPEKIELSPVLEGFTEGDTERRAYVCDDDSVELNF